MRNKDSRFVRYCTAVIGQKSIDANVLSITGVANSNRRRGRKTVANRNNKSAASAVAA